MLAFAALYCIVCSSDWLGHLNSHVEELDVQDRRFRDPKYVTSFLSNLANAGLVELAANAVTSLWKAGLQAGKQRIHEF